MPLSTRDEKGCPEQVKTANSQLACEQILTTSFLVRLKYLAFFNEHVVHGVQCPTTMFLISSYTAR